MPRIGLRAARGEPLEEVLRQEQDVAPALAERRHVDADDVDAVVEILAEALLVHLASRSRLVAVTMRASNGDLRVAADRAHLALLERAQELRLHLERQLADLVEEERAAASPARRGRRAAALASVKAPRACPNSSLSSSVGGIAAQLMATNGAVAPRAPVVERARDELLARAALARDEHRRVAVGDAGDEVEHPRIAALSPMSAAEALRVDDRLAEPLHLLAQPAVLERPRDREREELRVDRLGDEVVGAGADRARRRRPCWRRR